MTYSLGIVGGGQLARMTALDAVRLGVDVTVLAGPTDEGVRDVLHTIDGRFDDLEALRRLAAISDVVTFDHELVPLDLVRTLEADGVVVRPSADALEFADKSLQRQRFFEAGLAVPAFALVDDADGIDAFAAEHGWPVVLKAPHGGYDGRGVAVAHDLDDAAEMLTASAGRGLVIEEHLDLVRELAVLVVTGADGSVVVYPPVLTVQEDGMCTEVHAGPDVFDEVTVRRAQTAATRAADLVGAVGVLAVELFDVGEGRLLLNEIAPRPHNSGHLTIDGWATSQFENHARAVLGLPLGPVEPVAPATVMVNVVGGPDGDPRDRIADVDPTVKIHLYDKTPRPGRKIGHVTAMGRDLDAVAARARTAAAALEGRL